MRLGIVGGRLQGTEAVYLAREAGYETVLVDRSSDVPAGGLAHETHVLDVVAEPARALAVLATCDLVLPACEDRATLGWLDHRLAERDIPLLFDPAAYDLTCSKLRSDRLFARVGVPHPLPWPACGFPAVVKPSGASGSRGVRVVASAGELEVARHALESQGHEVVIQQYVAGPSLSVEVVRYGGDTRVLLPTALEFDRSHDCARVTAPVEVSPVVLAGLRDTALRLAEALDLRGVMDVEVMVDGDVPRVIEIDARLPSQTPTAVYHACGLNLVEVLAQAFMDGRLPAGGCAVDRAVLYEHVRVAGGRAEVLGEHVMAGAGPLRLVPGFFGADVALTDRGCGEPWAATVICRGVTLSDCRRKAERARMAMAAAR